MTGILTEAHQIIKQGLMEHDSPIAIDATVGNGHDTLFLSREVGLQGHVYGFDIQEIAIQRTRQRLQQEAQHNVTLHQIGHQHMDQFLPVEIYQRVQAIMFNLGYLPHGDHSIITKSPTTIVALQIAIDWLAPKGLVTLVLYTGHSGGQQEADAVLEWASKLPSIHYGVTWKKVVNRRQAPSLMVIEKKENKKHLP